ncbi:MAG: tRNA threonylcarbamoyladenosine dehydratase [Kiritimatiellae bacterium]|nr:tRNA threonylcarbamoyladenosine dehydratase [Kiritimatiellia bacterium]
MSESESDQTPDNSQASPFLMRASALLGAQTLARLQGLHLLIVGVGAVGGACAEALARSGVGRLTLIDGDCFEASNLNRQPFSSQSALGKPKVVVTCQQLADRAPPCCVKGSIEFICADSVAARLEAIAPDAVIDAIDDFSAKVALLEACVRRKIPVWSAMGAARKLDPLSLKITDISKTQVCPLARKVRQELRRRGIEKGIRCVWSAEPAAPLHGDILGSYMPVTAAAGLVLAADVIACYR